MKPEKPHRFVLKAFHPIHIHMLVFDKKYLDLKTRTAEMAVKVTDMIRQTVQAISEMDLELAKSVIKSDEEVNHLDNVINEVCIRSLALYNPKAANLRSIITILRLTVDLERIGDYCSNICKELLKNQLCGFVNQFRNLKQMGQLSEKMLTDAINACFKNHSDMAIGVILQDEQVNTLYRQIITDFLESGSSDKDIIQQVISIMYIARCFERIADHASNIARSVKYLTTGDFSRHLTIEELKGE